MFIAGQKIINRIKDSMKRDGLVFNEEQFLEAKRNRPRKERLQSPDQFELLKQLEKDIDVANMPVDIRDLEQNHDITNLTETQI